MMSATAGATAVFAVGATVATPPARADIPGLNLGSCSGRSAAYTLGTYDVAGKNPLPLRCGNTSFGFNHITKPRPGQPNGHYTDDINVKISNTLLYGEQRKGPNGVVDPGAKVLFDDQCKAIYLVAYTYNEYSVDPSIDPMGIVTAYHLDIVNTFTPESPAASEPADSGAASADASDFRTDCPQIVAIDYS
jgi:hypothetical protein